MIYSRQRETILNALRETKEHPTAEALHEMLKSRGEDVSMATIYRNLGQLTENGLVRRISSDGPDRFDADTSEHYHAICRRCGKTCDIFTLDVPDVCREANDAQKMIDVDRVNMLFWGVCNECLKQGKKEKENKSK